MTEKQLLDKLAELEKELHDYRRILADAKRKVLDAESNVISAKLHWDRVKEELRVHRNTVPRHDPTPQDKEIEAFREKFPELCELARDRDTKRGES